MALQDEVTPIMIPGWEAGDAQNAPKIWSSTTGDSNGSPARDSVMDETVPPSAIDVQMMLMDHDEHMNRASMSPQPEVHSSLLAQAGGDHEHPSEAPSDPGAPKPESQLTKPSEGTPIAELPLFEPSSMLTPTALPFFASTPRRSPRLSPIPNRSMNSTPQFSLHESVRSATPNDKSSTPVLHSSTTASIPPSSIPFNSVPSVQHTPVGAFLNQSSYFPAFPSPSLFASTSSWPAPPNIDVQDDHMQEEEGLREQKTQEETPRVQGEDAASQASESTLSTGIESGVLVDEGERIDETSNRDVQMSGNEDEALSTQTSLISPEKPLVSEEAFQSPQPPTNRPAANADLSSIFASPIPNMPHPVLSPLHMHQGFQPFALRSPPRPTQPEPSTFATPPQASTSNNNTGGARLSSLSPNATSLLDRLVDPFSFAAASQTLQMQAPSAPKKQSSIINRSDIANSAREKARSLMTPPSRVIMMGPSQDSHGSTLNTFTGSLVPITSPSNKHLPFPVTPQRNNALSRSFSDPTLTSPPTKDGSLVTVNDSGATRSTTPSSAMTFIHTPSKIPIPHNVLQSAPNLASGSSLVMNGARSSTTVTSPSMSIMSPSLLSPPGVSQLRQPSTLRSMPSGAASKIPRPGKKPYSKPASRLPKPTTKVGQVFPTAAPPKTSPLSPPTQVSPIKTRRGRLNAQNTTKPAPFVSQLPPDAIIFKPPPPRIRPAPEPPALPVADDTDVGTPEADEGLVSGRASPPIETGMSPPKSGLLLKSRAKRMKEEVASESAPPEFAATAPSLGIFPSLTRPGAKGRGRAAVQRPMLMPLDATALKRLTTNNTLRNQEYICSKVDVKIVLKEGKRPASPTTKVKTVLEKKKEQEKNDRKQRAAARATGRLGTPDSQDLEMQDGERKHPRGAGDDEEYHTPVKHRRERSEMDVDGPMMDAAKRVKWNKDLLQRFEPDDEGLEEIKSRAEKARASSASKSCIAVRWVLLDPLGNVPEAHVPIANLKKEDVVVTRLVYIDELPPSERPKRVAATKANSRITPP